MVVEGNTCQMDLVPIWLKRKGGLAGLASWGDEGERLVYFTFRTLFSRSGSWY